ncbi:EscU/YscU/HrcU family type III secretion system export apparatus switch protein [Parasphingorhabdus cellanae]|uniref:Flagellar biosynthesis protein FlhB n=1 Tax=Parasphingorhabdus cellanae TaxID=2806553 RepID=A0ABX7T1N6_9SPHN|nr:flagellar type III secretion system protein FlhB [Parasphingorhabdus cellanae]QTD55465.1 flagellar biosynthesis protein FlhB [Parasphingorhabdus cellanae]
MAQEAPGGGEKTEAPTPKKLKDSAEKGDVLKSQDLGGATVIFVGTAAMFTFGGALFQALADMLTSALVFDSRDVEIFDISGRSSALVSGLLPEFMSLFAVLLAAAIVVPAMLGSFGFRWSAMKPKPSKMDPIKGMGKIFGTNGLMELGKSIVKVLLIGIVGGVIIFVHLGDVMQLGAQDLNIAVASYASLFMQLLVGITISLMLIAMVDVPIQLFQRGKRLKMSKQEIKDEYKQTEGSPDTRAIQRQRRSEMLSDSTRKAVADATVILVNPTHFAVALRYDRDQDYAPIVLGKGCDAIALGMREMAAEVGTPVMEYPALTRSIYFTSQVGEVIDDRLYAAIAAVLSFLIQLDAKMVSPLHQPRIDVPEDMQFAADGSRLA